MVDAVSYHRGSRALQAEFGSQALADRLAQRSRAQFTPDDTAFIEGAPYFFLATTDDQGQPDCSFKGGAPGFVRVTGPSELAFPDYDGNGMFKSLGNIAIHAPVGLLFIAMHGQPRRLRVNGRARIVRDDPLMLETAGAQMIVRVEVDAIFPNCPRYIPTLEMVEASPYAPRSGEATLEPAWKTFEAFKDVVPPRRKTWLG